MPLLYDAFELASGESLPWCNEMLFCVFRTILWRYWCVNTEPSHHMAMTADEATQRRMNHEFSVSLLPP